MFFGDLLINARSGSAANDGVVVYRLSYQNFDDAIRRTIPSRRSLSVRWREDFQGYWPNLFSDGTGLYVVGSTTDILMAADITEAAHPAGMARCAWRRA